MGGIFGYPWEPRQVCRTEEDVGKGCRKRLNLISAETMSLMLPFPLSPTGRVTLYYQQGCTSALNCGRERASDAESRLTSRYSCCETDLCNEEWDEDPTD